MLRRKATPQEKMVEITAAYLDGALDDLIMAKLTLEPNPGEWSPPHQALGNALGDDPEWARGSRHLHEIEIRLRELLPKKLGLEGHLDEWRSEMLAHVDRAAEIGWRVGISTGLQRRGDA